MNFIPKEQLPVYLGLGDVIEYKCNDNVIRLMVVKGFDDEGLWGYKLFDLKNIEVLEEMYDGFSEIVNGYKGVEGFRIIKSSNLELREV
ncbi:hypothetical protein [Turicibacter sanguinis]|uniref:hypothetical protein n=1 Tax=Turicibacter sanguinis TaxID=154288 RepID=UPI0006C31CD6|nr:hypothetical protein [Turicibacter sanguinis]MDB8438621.1 hypothetical protein [Turicibacter sanguinis]MTO25216.1 hypothetical protein [Turicibacter sanguinis]MTO28112.1 hypothetical protein [Turicibacter sanguinis]MTO91050.1 hypothetical protein [Turicibacter sanguinis]MTP71199.1 hypothetical protein [Turicibacter sanguinis]